MYLSHYSLREMPFQLSPNPKFLWLGEKHKEALATLKYGIMANRGFLLLTGDVGTGKTTLVNTLMDQLGKETIIALIRDPKMGRLEFYNYIANAFHMHQTFASKGDFLVHFSHFLHSAHKKNSQVLLIIDEAQRITDELLEELRHLSNIEAHDKKLLMILLAGQNELNVLLKQERNRALRQRISVYYNLKPLTENDVSEYIKHRLRVAGSEKRLFTSSALKEIASYSKGYPRLINVICDHALLTGYARGFKRIDANVIKECEQELLLPSEKEPEAAADRSGLLTREEPSRKRLRKAVGFAAVALLVLAAFGYFVYPGKEAVIEKYMLAHEISQPPASLDSESPQPRIDEAGVSHVILGRETELESPEALTTSPGAFSQLEEQDLSVYFEFNSNEVSQDGLEKLDRVADYLEQYPEKAVTLKGYTDKSGSYSYNKMLSKFRAEVVKNYLVVGRRIDASRITTVGMGPAEPTGPGDGNSARWGRRVEIELGENGS